MKKVYMKPDMQVVKIHRHCVICSSPAGMDGYSVGKFSGDSEKLGDESDVW